MSVEYFRPVDPEMLKLQIDVISTVFRSLVVMPVMGASLAVGLKVNSLRNEVLDQPVSKESALLILNEIKPIIEELKPSLKKGACIGAGVGITIEVINLLGKL